MSPAPIKKDTSLTVYVQPSLDPTRVHDLVDGPSPPTNERLGGAETGRVFVHLVQNELKVKTSSARADDEGIKQNKIKKPYVKKKKPEIKPHR